LSCTDNCNARSFIFSHSLGLASRYFEEILLALIGNQVPGVTPDEIVSFDRILKGSFGILCFLCGLWYCANNDVYTQPTPGSAA